MTAVPGVFGRAYEGLVEFVHRVSAGEVWEEILPEEVDRWRREGCRGAQNLAMAAVLALASEGLESTQAGSGHERLARLRALSRVQAVLEPTRTDAASPGPEIVEVALPEQLRERMPRGRAFTMGELQILFEPTQGPPHGLLSVSHPGRYPTFGELSRAARAPGGPPPNLWALVPKPETAQQMQPNAVHLYVLPPEELLG